MTVVNDVKLGPDPSGYFQIGHIYYGLSLVDYDSVIDRKYQASDLRFIEFIPAYVFLGAREDCEEGCPRPYVFKGCMPLGFHESPHQTKVVNFKNLEDARSLAPLEDVAKHYLKILEARRERKRRESESDHDTP